MNLDAIIAKNSLDDGGLWAFLLKLESPKLGITIHLTRNTDDITWNGVTYTAASFNIGDYKEGIKGQLPSLSLTVSNVDRVVQSYVEQDPDFGSNWNVDLYVLYLPAPVNLTTTRTEELHYHFLSISVECNETTAVFRLGMENPLKQLSPKNKLIPNYCQATFKVAETGCPYTGTATTCEKTLAACKAYFPNTDVPFGGFPAIPTGAGVFKV